MLLATACVKKLAKVFEGKVKAGLGKQRKTMEEGILRSKTELAAEWVEVNPVSVTLKRKV